MSALTDAMQTVLNAMDIFPLATASRLGEPNVVPIKFVSIRDADTLWIADNFLHKTLMNLRENPRASIYAWKDGHDLSFQVKGDTRILTAGSDYEAMRAYVRGVKPDAPARALIVFAVTAVYDCRPGSNAGQPLYRQLN